MHKRNILNNLLEALNDTPVVLLNGARQTGKSTLVKWLAKNDYPATYFNLDNAATLASVLADPASFVAQLSTPVIIDEIQRAPNLLLAIKEAVDENRRPGHFLLTGSANVLLLPQVSDSLAGRMEIINLWTLSQGEIANIKEKFTDALFTNKFTLPSAPPLNRNALIDIILQGGYPEILTRKTAHRRSAWYNSYITAILQRDVRDIANIEGLTQLPRLLSLLAARISSLMNLAEISRATGIPHTTLIRYMTLLQTIFLIHTVPAWSNNQSKRIVKTPKLYLCDTGLASYLLGLTLSRLNTEPGLIGPLLENFVVMELKKQLGWSKATLNMFHYRTASGQEVDIVLENLEGRCVGIEVKASANIMQQDFKGLIYLSEHLGNRFLRGIVLYTGNQILSFGKELYAVPINCLWNVIP
ncbi:MAG: ATP-binding protein [Gammaproteobacteria bacterium]|nr:ATP-binding protein [Gammaproteobacteria bacterium]